MWYQSPWKDFVIDSPASVKPVIRNSSLSLRYLQKVIPQDPSCHMETKGNHLTIRRHVDGRWLIYPRSTMAFDTRLTTLSNRIDSVRGGEKPE